MKHLMRTNWIHNLPKTNVNENEPNERKAHRSASNWKSFVIVGNNWLQMFFVINLQQFLGHQEKVECFCVIDWKEIFWTLFSTEIEKNNPEFFLKLQKKFDLICPCFTLWHSVFFGVKPNYVNRTHFWAKKCYEKFISVELFVSVTVVYLLVQLLWFLYVFDVGEERKKT